MAEGKPEKSVEARLADIEDKLSKIMLSDEEVRTMESASSAVALRCLVCVRCVRCGRCTCTRCGGCRVCRAAAPSVFTLPEDDFFDFGF